MSPLWALKYVVEKGAEFNSVIDSLFSLANATGDSITQEDVSELLEGLKKQKTSIALTLEKVKDSMCFYAFVDKCLKKVNVKLDDYSNLMSYLKQNLSDAIVFWREDDVEKQIFQWCILQNKPVVTPKSEPDSGDEPYIPDYEEGDDEEIPGDADNDEEDETEDFDDGLFDSPDFEPIEITPISIGKTHATIEAATTMINEKEFDDGEAKEILVKLCKEYPVVCSAVMKLLSGE
ncbi:MAG: hypothetical protein K2O32_09190 [Acetatifactor sp.]|nr:hypothetical protein [Acetatifactor sp.]